MGSVSMQNSVVVRIRGGVGNQLFCYAAGRGLAIRNQAELIIDDVTAFRRDQYGREYLLDNYNVAGRKANPKERLDTLGRLGRPIFRIANALRKYEDREYILQLEDFDPRLLSMKMKGQIYLDGYWQGEAYFKDVEDDIRNDLRLRIPFDPARQDIAQKINETNSIAVHFRTFVARSYRDHVYNLEPNYYLKAIRIIKENVEKPHFFIFVDSSEKINMIKGLPWGTSSMVFNDSKNISACYDLCLMSHCKHFVIANSTFSWWGAWLSQQTSKIIIAPNYSFSGAGGTWGFNGLIPAGWIKI